MKIQSLQPEIATQTLLEEVVGYLNFSSGAKDPKFLQNVNELFRCIESASSPEASMRTLNRWLMDTIDRLQQAGGPFVDVTQARSVVGLLQHELLPAYRQFHGDLLYRQSQADLWRPLFIGQAWELILAQGAPWEETDRIISSVLTQMNDFVGYRPVAMLESGHPTEPYPHEFVRPIPLYIRHAGVAVGRYERIIRLALEILHNVDEDILARAWFEPEHLEEISLDPRVYDFDQPVNRRPNYHFGQWDPHQISRSGYYTRFVLQQVSLDALLKKCECVDGPKGKPEGIDSELQWIDAATVLVGTMLMASGTTGDGPGRHDSTVTLSTLMPQIASYRDDFYEQVLSQAEGAHAVRLSEEAEQYHQPFGATRQYLNHELARRRALQLQRVHLAHVFSRMGYPEAALRQAESVRVAAARLLSEIYCRLTAGHDSIDSGELDSVVEDLGVIEALLHRAIECGALVDPRNVVGFAGNFSLFSALEDTVHDWRVDELIELVEQILDLCARAWSDAAAKDNGRLEKKFSAILSGLATWWDQYATSSVEDVKWLVAKEIEVSANLVAGALNAWHKAGAAAGDVAFWRMFVDQFDSSKAFQLVIEALLEQKDTVASMALMMQWVSQKESTPLEEGDCSFHRLVLLWLAVVEAEQQERDDDNWPQIAKFFAYLEANAEEYWQVPTLSMDSPLESMFDEVLDDIEGATYFEDEQEEADSEDPEDEEGELFDAAYEKMVFRDSTDDGIEGDIVEEGFDLETSEWEYEVQRLEQRLGFLTTVARLWNHAAISWGPTCREHAERRESFDGWLAQASINYRQLVQLLETVHAHRFQQPTGSHDSLVEFDRLRTLKESLIQQILTTCVETCNATRLLMATRGERAVESAHDLGEPFDEVSVRVLQAVLARDVAGVQACWEDFLLSLQPGFLLYVPHSRGGDPKQIVATRGLQQLLYDLLGWLPQLGLLSEACQLLDAAQQMEIDHPVGNGAVTEFDRLFENGYQAIVKSLVVSAESWSQTDQADEANQIDNMLVDALQQLTERQLDRWLRHSRTLRLSVVERLGDEETWQRFVEFIQEYGGDLFDQRFLSLGNLRGILHQGVDLWIDNMLEDPDAVEQIRLLENIDLSLKREDAVEMLTLAFEAVVENYRTYLDYNTTTTQSDHGEKMFCLIDFLRLRSAYDRVSWNLKPVVWAHEILVRHHRIAASEMWFQAFAERTAEESDMHIRRFEKLCQKYGMRLATVADRLGERFLRPLMIDRVKALVGPAMKDTGDGDSKKRLAAFSALEGEVASLGSEPSGSGFDLPDWLAALEEEVSEARSRLNHLKVSERLTRQIGQVQLSWNEVVEQLSEPE